MILGDEKPLRAVTPIPWLPWWRAPVRSWATWLRATKMCSATSPSPTWPRSSWKSARLRKRTWPATPSSSAKEVTL
ncbi:hypothetical protein EVA_18913 [gut metagenome]|uniref:Uncharacterized protein n=1 Tax=gut metagenome TaxID=749906 RepID=J9FDJ9_9ZZZZ